jgi:hypothetical protein
MPNCDTGFRVNEQGKCEKCPDYHTVEPIDKISCMKAKCKDNEIIAKNGTCSKCPK